MLLSGPSGPDAQSSAAQRQFSARSDSLAGRLIN